MENKLESKAFFFHSPRIAGQLCVALIILPFALSIASSLIYQATVSPGSSTIAIFSRRDL